MRRLVGLVIVSALLAGCAGAHGGGLIPSSFTSPEQTAQRVGHLDVSIKIPMRKHRGHRGRYVSPSTQSIEFKVFDSTHKHLLETVKKNLTPSSKGCTTASDATVCTLSIALLPGKDTLDVTTFDGAKGTGHPLSAMVAHPVTIKAGKNNRLALTLGGLAASFSVTTGNALQSMFSTSTGLSIVGSLPQSITILPLDADGNTIVGVEAPTPVIQATPASTTLAAPAAGSHAYTLTSTFNAATNPTVPHASSISVSASPVPGSGGATVAKTIPLALYQPWIYVVDYSNLTLKAFDEAGNAKTLSGSFTGLSAPYYAVYSPSSHVLYVSDWYDVKTYDAMGNAATTSGSFTTATGLGQPSFDTNNNFLYFPNYDTSVVSVYDLQGNTQSLSGTPFGSVASPWVSVYDSHNGFIYVPNYTAKTMGVYDEQGVAQTVSGTFAGLNGTYGLAFDPNNNLIYAANDAGGAPLTVYDEAGNLQTLSGAFTGASGASGIVFDPYDNMMYVSTGAGVLKFDEQGNTQTLGAGTFSGLSSSIYGIAAVP